LVKAVGLLTDYIHAKKRNVRPDEEPAPEVGDGPVTHDSSSDETNETSVHGMSLIVMYSTFSALRARWEPVMVSVVPPWISPPPSSACVVRG
jgi:hypothetical protein